MIYCHIDAYALGWFEQDEIAVFWFHLFLRALCV